MITIGCLTYFTAGRKKIKYSNPKLAELAEYVRIKFECQKNGDKSDFQSQGFWYHADDHEVAPAKSPPTEFPHICFFELRNRDGAVEKTMANDLSPNAFKHVQEVHQGGNEQDDENLGRDAT